MILIFLFKVLQCLLGLPENIFPPGEQLQAKTRSPGCSSARFAAVWPPPVGPTMVVGCAIGKVSMEAVSKSIIVFYIPMVIVLLLITYIPALCLWLPHLVLD